MIAESTKDRKNSWTTSEEQLLVEAVLENTSKGFTLVETFNALSKELKGRTHSALNYHWTKNLKPKYSKEFSKARAEGKALKKENLESSTPVVESKTTNIVEQAETKIQKKMNSNSTQEQKNSSSVTFESLVSIHFQEFNSIKEELALTNGENKELKSELKKLQIQLKKSETAISKDADSKEVTLLREENAKLREALEHFNSVFQVNKDLISKKGGRKKRIEQLAEVQNEMNEDKVASGS